MKLHLDPFQSAAVQTAIRSTGFAKERAGRLLTEAKQLEERAASLRVAAGKLQEEDGAERARLIRLLGEATGAEIPPEAVITIGPAGGVTLQWDMVPDAPVED